MTTILIVGAIVLGILHYLYPEQRKKLRIAIVAIVAIILLSFASTSFGCAVNMSPMSLATFDWDVISFQHERCMFEHNMTEMMN